MKKLREKGEKLRKWEWKLVYLLSNCRIRQYLLIFLQFCLGEGKFAFEGGLIIHGCEIYTPVPAKSSLYKKAIWLQKKVHVPTGNLIRLTPPPKYFVTIEILYRKDEKYA